MTEIKESLLTSMTEYFGEDSRRINHAIRVTAYAEQMLEPEGGDYDIVLGASVLHDVGIRLAEEKYGSAAGRLQEIEGPPVAREILESLDFRPEQIDEICDIIAHHHSPGKTDTANFRILWDSDWLVNLSDEFDIHDRTKLAAIIERVFMTETGRRLAREIYLEGKSG